MVHKRARVFLVLILVLYLAPHASALPVDRVRDHASEIAASPDGHAAMIVREPTHEIAWWKGTVCMIARELPGDDPLAGTCPKPPAGLPAKKNATTHAHAPRERGPTTIIDDAPQLVSHASDLVTDTAREPTSLLENIAWFAGSVKRWVIDHVVVPVAQTPRALGDITLDAVAAIGAFASSIARGFAACAHFIVDAARALATGFLDGCDAAWNALVSAFDTARDGVAHAGSRVSDATQAAWAKVTSLFTSAPRVPNDSPPNDLVKRPLRDGGLPDVVEKIKRLPTR